VILHFRRTLQVMNPDDGYVEEYTCIEHPRLSHMQQCGKKGGSVHTSFFVRGIANYFPSIGHALIALAANPTPGEICSVTPWEICDVG
jgi:hypothetical protein